jgi:DNA-binding beta-propeller fold protein YncE
MEIAAPHELLIGREEQGVGNLRGDPEISRRHARVSINDAGVLLVEDLGSTNGTFVNDRRLTGQRVLRAGDRLRVGATTIEVLAGERADAGATRQRPQPVPPTGPGAPLAAPALDPFPPRRTDPRRPGSNVPILAAGLFGALLLLALGYLIGHRSGGSSSASAAGGGAPAAGIAYVESNVAMPGANSVLALRYGLDGNLHPLGVAEYPTGGAGSEDLSDSGVLDADGQVTLDQAHKLLFAVNQGSDSVAVFHVHGDGELSAVRGSPFPSGGSAPASVGVSGNTAIVTDKAQDGVRDLSSVAPGYVTFHINRDGSLSQFGPTIHAAPASSPTDAFVAPKYNFVMSTEEGGPFRGFIVDSRGLTQGANSPLEPDPSIFPANLIATKRWGLGISAHPSEPIVYIGMATVDKIAVYTYDRNGALRFERSVEAPGSDLPCWTHVNAAGTRLYTANAGNNTMSVFDTGDALHPKWIQTIKLNGEGNPWNFQIDPSGKLIFLVDPRSRANVAPGRGQAVHTLVIAPDGRLSEPGYSPVVLPVALNVNPFGLAVMPTS